MDESKVNSLSDFFRRARARGTRDISVLFVFDLEAMELVCSKCFPGNIPNVTPYEAFIKENQIIKGFIVGDKGFPESAAHEEFESYPDQHYPNSIKRKSRPIARHSTLNFTAILPDYEGIAYRKEKCVGIEKWHCSYRSSARAAKE